MHGPLLRQLGATCQATQEPTWGVAEGSITQPAPLVVNVKMGKFVQAPGEPGRDCSFEALPRNEGHDSRYRVGWSRRLRSVRDRTVRGWRCGMTRFVTVLFVAALGFTGSYTGVAAQENNEARTGRIFPPR